MARLDSFTHSFTIRLLAWLPRPPPKKKTVTQVNTDFTDSDIRGASMEDTSMDGASLKNAVAVGSYFSASILDTATVENADFSDAQFPVKALPLLCARPDMKGTNPVTGVDTRESAMCP